MMKKQDPPQVFSLLPLRDIIVFPHMVVPLFVGREKSIRALEEAMSSRKQIILSAQKKAQNNNPDEKDIFTIGTLAISLGYFLYFGRIYYKCIKLVIFRAAQRNFLRR
mgnify:CR=1 FL=1